MRNYVSFKAIVLCEGTTDQLFLRQLIESKGYEKERGKNYKIDSFECYKNRLNEWVGLASVGGCDFSDALISILDSIKYDINKAPSNIVIVSDNDDLETKKSRIDSVKKIVENHPNASCKETNEVDALYIEYKNKLGANEGSLKFIFVPYNTNGALETFILDSLADIKDEGALVKELSEEFIDSLPSFEKYLKHRRDKVKAKLGVTYSIFEPERSVDSFNRMLNEISFDKFESIEEQFAALFEVL